MYKTILSLAPLALSAALPIVDTLGAIPIPMNATIDAGLTVLLPTWDTPMDATIEVTHNERRDWLNDTLRENEIEYGFTLHHQPDLQGNVTFYNIWPNGPPPNVPNSVSPCILVNPEHHNFASISFTPGITCHVFPETQRFPSEMPLEYACRGGYVSGFSSRLPYNPEGNPPILAGLLKPKKYVEPEEVWDKGPPTWLKCHHWYFGDDNSTCFSDDTKRWCGDPKWWTNDGKKDEKKIYDVSPYHRPKPSGSP